MGRPFLVGMVGGATLALAGVAIATIWIRPDADPVYLRIADDNFDYLLGPDHGPGDGPMSARLIRHCGIETFTLDLAVPDRGGSAFVNLENTPRAKLNCLIGEARIHGLSLAIVDGEDTAAFECLPGWPSRFQRFDPADYGSCPKGEPNPVVGKGPALEAANERQKGQASPPL